MSGSVVIRDQSYIKYRNIQTVLTLLTENQPISRTEIARITEMSPTSITRIIGALLSLGLVDERRSDAESKRGRKAMDLVTRAEGICTAGISLEPHRIRLGIVDFCNTLHHAHEIPITQAEHNTPEALAITARAAIERLKAGEPALAGSLRAVGVCAAGPVDCEAGIVTKSDQMKWQDAAVGEAFARVFGLPAYVENDVKACLTGEKIRRGIPERQDAAYLLIGTGVGLAATANGKLIRGRRNEAGEIAALPADALSSLQEHLVETAMVQRAQRAEPAVQSMEDVISAYRQGLSWARMLIADFLRVLRMTIDIIEGICDPHYIILGGSIVHKLDWLIQDALLGEHLCIGENYGDACIVGAALIAQRQAVQTLISRELDD